MKADKRKTEREICKFIEENSSEFVKRLKKHFREIDSMGRDNHVAKKVQQIGEDVHLDANNKVSSDSNGRKSTFDLSGESGDITFVVELKLGNVGFRGVGQAAYYSACVRNKVDFVLLIGEEKGPDLDDFLSKCIRPKISRKIAFVRYEEIGLDHGEGGENIAFRKA